MKGKSIFTKKEADEIIALITQKLKASASEQKKIRDKIRKLGFYASDFGIGGGYTVADFKKVAKILEQNSPELIQSLKPQKKLTEIKNKFIEPSSALLNFDSDTLDELKQNGFKGFKTVSEIIKNVILDIGLTIYRHDSPGCFVEHIFSSRTSHNELAIHTRQFRRAESCHGEQIREVLKCAAHKTAVFLNGANTIQLRADKQWKCKFIKFVKSDFRCKHRLH